MNSFTVDDRLQLHELANRYGNTLDSRDWLRFQTCFTDDCRYELRGFGRLDQVIQTSESLRLFMEGSTQHPVAHHVTNIEIELPDTNSDGDRTLMFSKIVGTLPNGSAGSADYHDVVVRRGHGWQIAERLVTRRR
jgi:hypothetical protein